MIAINNYDSKYLPTFKSYKHEVFNQNGTIKYRGDTCMFRGDLDFTKIVNFFENKYKDISKVKVIIHACSDGEEVYSFIAKLLDSIGIQKASKYFPVSARDIDEGHINLAKSGKYTIEDFEQYFINSNLSNGYKQYFDNNGINFSRICISAKENLKNHVNFSTSNILDDVKSNKLKNTVLFARNFWPYLSKEDAKKLAKYLSYNMDNSSALIIGNFDKSYNIDFLLNEYGFIEDDSIANLFLKDNRNNINNSIKKYLRLLKKIIKK